MPVFLLSFFTVYASVHAYALHKIRSALGLGTHATAALAPPFLLLTFAPLLVHLLSRSGHETAARAAAAAGYTWMGFLFVFFWINLSLDAANTAGRAVNLLLGRGARPLFPYEAPLLCATAVAAVLLCAFGAIEAERIRAERVRIETEKLPPGVDRIRIAQISDLHLGLIVRDKAARRVAAILREEAPDIVVSTGDLVDAQVNHIRGLAEIFAAVRAPLGKYAVTGNHEYYAGIAQALEFTRRAGFAVLRGEAVSPGGVLRLAGVDDEAKAAFEDLAPLPGAEALGGGRSSLFTVLLKHRPRPPRGAAGLFDLQLSGHTHGGQIFPFGLVVRRTYPFFEGIYRLDGGAFLWVSRGTGTWGPRMRILSPPEVSIIDIVRRRGRI